MIFVDRYILDQYCFLLTFTGFIFQKLIMVDHTLTNEMKRHDTIVALKVDHGHLESARFLRVTRSFVHKIRKELEKENDEVTSVSKHKKTFHTSRFNENIRIYSYSKADNWWILRSINEVNCVKVACVWKDNQKECSWRHSIQILRDEGRLINF